MYKIKKLGWAKEFEKRWYTMLTGESWKVDERPAIKEFIHELVKTVEAAAEDCERKRILEEIKKLPSAFPEEESDGLDDGYNRAKQDIVKLIEDSENIISGLVL